MFIQLALLNNINVRNFLLRIFSWYFNTTKTNVTLIRETKSMDIYSSRDNSFDEITNLVMRSN